MNFYMGLKFSKIFIIQSLKSYETDTGRQLSEYVLPLAIEGGLDFEFKVCESSSNFLEVLKGLEIFAESGGIPLLHIECHGDDIGGIEFSDKSSMSWAELSLALYSINVKTGFNLLAVISACFGSYLLSEEFTVNDEVRSPVSAFIGPSSVISPDESLRGFMSFYNVLLTYDRFSDAWNVLRKQKLKHGRWSLCFAEKVFESCVSKLIKNQWDLKSISAMARNKVRHEKTSGKRLSLGSARRMIRAHLKDSIPGSLFDTYFSIDLIPANRERFKDFRKKISSLSRSI